MDSLIGEKAYIQPPAEASSEGPESPNRTDQQSSTSQEFSPLVRSKKIQSNNK